MLISVELWRRTRVILIYAALVMLVGEAITVLGVHRVTPSYLVVAVALLALAAGIYLRSRTHYVEAGPTGLILRSSFRQGDIPYDAVRQSRCQTLRVFLDTPSRRELLSGGLKRFAGRPVCLVRVELDHGTVLRLGQLVGRSTVVDQDLLLLVEHAEDLDRELQAHIRRRPQLAAAKPPRRK